MLRVYFHILYFPAQVLLQFTTVCLMLIKGSFLFKKLPFYFLACLKKVVRSRNLSNHSDLHLCLARFGYNDAYL